MLSRVLEKRMRKLLKNPQKPCQVDVSMITNLIEHRNQNDYDMCCFITRFF